jgi:hypothetical protein
VAPLAQVQCHSVLVDSQVEAVAKLMLCCCGVLQNHMDLSVWAFQKLTDMKWGVIPIE